MFENHDSDGDGELDLKEMHKIVGEDLWCMMQSLFKLV